MIETLTTAISGHGPMVKMVWILLAVVILDIASRLLIRKMAALTQKSKTAWDDALIESIGAPVHWLIWVVGLTVALGVSGILPEDIAGMLHVARILIVIALFSWFLFRLIESFGNNLVGTTTLSGGTIDRSLVDIASKLIKLIVVVLAVLISMQTLGFSLTGLLAFGGIGGLAKVFAAK
ncbi:MAG: hypothetical protein F4X92_09830, partial [Gammaproteobacteria bacterium]|nr:hypothetical protein [Gammaproteobacteria bacterium]